MMYNTNQTNFGGAQGYQMGGQGYYAPQGQMYGNPAMYGQPMKVPEYTNPISDKEAQELMAKGNGGIKLEITSDQYRQGICTHRTSKGPACHELPDGRWKCDICGAEWNMVEDVNQEDILQVAENLHDVMHTAKFMWTDIPPQICKDYFQVLPVVDQIPKIFNIASDRYAKTLGSQGGMNPMYQNGTQNTFAMLGQIAGSPMGYGYGTPMNAGYQQPMMQQPMMYGQPAPQQPQQVPMMTPMQQAMVGQGLPGYEQPQAAPAPQATPAPAPAAQAAAPAQPAGEVSVTNTLSV